MSPTFVCDECGALENTALGSFWMPRMKGEPVLCSECKTGEWHGWFPKEQYDPDKDYGNDPIKNRR